TLEQLLLYKEFLRAVIAEIKQELRKRVESSLWERVKESVTGSVSERFEGLDSVLEEADEERFISALGVRRTKVQAKTADTDESSGKISSTVKLSAKPGAS